MTASGTPSPQGEDKTAEIRRFGLLDAESGNILGTFAAEGDALRVVASLAGRYGQQATAVSALVLYRNDVPDEESVIAEGLDLLMRAGVTAQSMAHT